MVKRFFSILAALLFMAGAAPMAQAELAAVGPPIDPHGFPSFYQDTEGLSLELCLPAPAGFATRPELCVFDPLDETSPIVVAGEVFWWLASSSMDVPGGGRAVLTLGIEGTFGGSEAAIDGQQIAFGRTRIRVDTPVAGTYTVTHPYGTQVFEVAEGAEADGINYTADIGAANFQDPANGFLGTLAAPLGPYLTWENYTANPDLQVLELDELGQPTGNILEQYVGDPNVLSPVVGGPNGNIFRVEGPNGFDVQTDLFSVMGKVYDPDQVRVTHVFPEVPFPVLYAVGPVNRVAPFAVPTTGTVTGVDLPYSVGYPIWYQENSGTIAEPAPGLRYTLCNPGTPTTPNPMCISDPIDPADPAQVELRTGGEGFWWSADASIDNGDDQYLLVLGLEATFGGDESLIDGQQISFARERIRIDTSETGAGTYRITHPYGVRIYEAAAAEPGGINETADIGIANPADPDGAFVGALYSLGPQLLKWTTFNPDPALTDPLLIAEFVPGQITYHVGSPLVDHAVVGSPTGTNLFRVEMLVGGTVEDGEWEVLGETTLFAVSGQVFDPVALGLPAGSGTVGVVIGGTWYLDGNNNGIYEQGVDMQLLYGSDTDQPLMGDWNGDGISTPGVKRGNTYYLRNSNDSGVADIAFVFGDPNDTPIVGDWDGNGTDTIGVKRDNTYYLRNSNDSGIADASFIYGDPADTPIFGDWDGNGTDTIGVKRGNTYYLRNTNDSGIADITFIYGGPTDIPVTGDWDGNGSDTIGVYRSESGVFYLRNSNTEGIADVTLNFGITGGVPVSGSW